MANDTEQKIVFYNSILKVLNRYRHIISNYHSFLKIKLDFEYLVISLNLNKIYTNSNEKHFNDKNDIEYDLLESFLIINSTLNQYSNYHKKNDLKSSLENLILAFKKGEDHHLLFKSKELAYLTEKNLGELVNFGFNSENLEAFKRRIKLYEIIISGKSSSFKENDDKFIKDLFISADHIIEEEIDNYIRIIKSQSSEFWDNYMKIRQKSPESFTN